MPYNNNNINKALISYRRPRDEWKRKRNGPSEEMSYQLVLEIPKIVAETTRNAESLSSFKRLVAKFDFSIF